MLPANFRKSSAKIELGTIRLKRAVTIPAKPGFANFTQEYFQNLCMNSKADYVFCNFRSNRSFAICENVFKNCESEADSFILRQAGFILRKKAGVFEKYKKVKKTSG
jgi:hypothetical protein